MKNTKKALDQAQRAVDKDLEEFLHKLNHDARSKAARVKGLLSLPADAAAYNVSADFRLSWPDMTDHFSGRIAHFALFNRTLTAAERDGVTNWYKQRYPSLNYALV